MQPWKVCRFCQLSHQDFAAAQEERRSEVRGEAGSEPNAEFAAGRPRSQDSKGEGAGAPREKPAPEPRGRRRCGRRRDRGGAQHVAAAGKGVRAEAAYPPAAEQGEAAGGRGWASGHR